MLIKIIEMSSIVDRIIRGISAIMRLVQLKELLKNYCLFPIFLEGILQ